MSSKTSLVAGKHFCVPESTRSGLWTRPRRYSVLPDRLSAVPEHLEPHFGSIFLKDEINGKNSCERRCVFLRIAVVCTRVNMLLFPWY